MALFAVVLLSLAISTQAGFFVGKDKVSVKGVITCGSKPAVNEIVQMWDEDLFSADDQMGETTTNDRGEFSFSGFHSDRRRHHHHRRHNVGNVEPYLWIKHRCGKEGKQCEYRTRVDIPSSFINSDTAWPADIDLQSGQYTTKREKICDGPKATRHHHRRH